MLPPLLQVLPHVPPPPLLQSSNPCPTITWVLLPPHIFLSSPWSHHQHSRTHLISQRHQYLSLTTQIFPPTLQVLSSSLSPLTLRSPHPVPPPLLLVPPHVPPPHCVPSPQSSHHARHIWEYFCHLFSPHTVDWFASSPPKTSSQEGSWT